MFNFRVEWFEIVEPCTKEEIFVNMFTGECVWHPPHGALVLVYHSFF